MNTVNAYRSPARCRPSREARKAETRVPGAISRFQPPRPLCDAASRKWGNRQDRFDGKTKLTALIRTLKARGYAFGDIKTYEQ